MKTSPFFPLFSPSFPSSSILAESRSGRAGGGEGRAARAVEGEQTEGGDGQGSEHEDGRGGRALVGKGRGPLDGSSAAGGELHGGVPAGEIEQLDESERGLGEEKCAGEQDGAVVEWAGECVASVGVAREGGGEHGE